MFRQCVSFPLFYYSSVTYIYIYIWYSNGVEYIDVKRVKRRRTRRLRMENIFQRERATSQRRGQYNKKAALVERRGEEMITSVTGFFVISLRPSSIALAIGKSIAPTSKVYFYNVVISSRYYFAFATKM